MTENPFVRKFSEDAVSALKKTPLFQGHLRSDIVGGECKGKHFVFPAVRNEEIHFYWGGGRLFSYKMSSGYSTNQKFASVLIGKDGDISEDILNSPAVRLIEDFCEGYDRIKENCKNYSGLEALGVSSLYERFSCARKGAAGVVILDIEASFAKDGNVETTDEGQRKKKSDRIDIISMDTQNGMLRFIEAKHYSNGELRSSSGEPAVVGQMKRYEKQIKNRHPQILEAYKNQAKVINKIFSGSIPEPSSVDLHPILLIFGFDNDQKKGYLTSNIIPSLEAHDLRVYSVGDVKKQELEIVFRGGKQNWD